MPAKKPRKRLPAHVGFIPDGNRRWAERRGMARQEGYGHGIEPGIALFETCRSLGIPEISIYGFTQDNTRRPSIQTRAFQAACVRFGLEVHRRGAALLALGDGNSALFPAELKPFLQRRGEGIRVNLLVNYGWQWDLDGLKDQGRLRSQEVGPIDMVVRWGGGRRLSGFLPVQSVYADFYVVDDYWPDFKETHFAESLAWFARQDRTFGG